MHVDDVGARSPRDVRAGRRAGRLSLRRPIGFVRGLPVGRGHCVRERPPPGRYSVGWESFVILSTPPGAGGWSASDGFLSSPEPVAFVEAALGPVPLPGEVALAALGVDPLLAFSVTRGSAFEASIAFDALRVRAVVRAIAVGCDRGEAADG